MRCRYTRMAILQRDQTDFIVGNQSREQYIYSTIAKNQQFKHKRTTLYYSPRLIKHDLIAGVIERKKLVPIKSGPWENRTHTEETFRTANFAIRLNNGQEVALEQQNDVYTGNAKNVFESLSDHINKQKNDWNIYFRYIGSQENLDEYLKKHIGAIKRITIIFEKPNADFGAEQAIHDDLKESLTRIKANKLTKIYESESKNMEPDEFVLNEMRFANGGNGEVRIANKDDQNKSSSYQTTENELASKVDDNRKLDEIEDDNEKTGITNNMLKGITQSNDENNN